tara:strand:+ start:1934 stop:2326 length:393 start_codon:yes stop_codon:yes gene_type:complete
MMKKTMKRAARRNFGFGRQLRYSMSQALNIFYGDRDHYGTRRTHNYRLRIFARFCRKKGLVDARLITQSTLDSYGEYLRCRLEGDYVWPDGDADKSISTAYAHNLIDREHGTVRDAQELEDRAISATRLE